MILVQIEDGITRARKNPFWTAMLILVAITMLLATAFLSGWSTTKGEQLAKRPLNSEVTTRDRLSPEMQKPSVTAIDAKEFHISEGASIKLAPFPILASTSFYAVKGEVIGDLTFACRGELPVTRTVHDRDPIIVSCDRESFAITINAVDFDRRTAKIIVSPTLNQNK